MLRVIISLVFLLGIGDVAAGDSPNYTVSVFAGKTGVSGSANGEGAEATFRNPHAIASDAQGNLYVADTLNHVIRKITPGRVVSTYAGAMGQAGTANGIATARFSQPEGVCVDSAGNVYVSEIGAHTIRKITPGREVSTIAGLANAPGSADGTGSAARFRTPVTIEVDSAGFLYVGDFGNHTIRRVSPEGVVETFAGIAGTSGHRDGHASQALFFNAHMCRPDNHGNFYVTDFNNHVIRKIDANRMVTTVAGQVAVQGSADGRGSDAQFYHPWGMAFERSGSLLITDRENSLLRRVTVDGVVTTLAGVALSDGSADGRGTSVRLNRPRGITIVPSGDVFWVDLVNQTVRVGRADPTLAISYSGNAVSLRWPASADGFVLQGAAAADPAGWVNLSEPPVLDGELLRVTVPASGQQQYFRLAMP